MIFFTVAFSKFCKKSRSSHQRFSIEKAVLNNFAIFAGKRACQSLFLRKLQAFRSATLLNRHDPRGEYIRRKSERRERHRSWVPGGIVRPQL